MAPMMRLVLGLGVLVLILSAVALGLPAHVTATRSVVINAPEYVVFPYLNNLRRFQEWAPWSDKDPNIKLTYSGPPEGNGAKVEWTKVVDGFAAAGEPEHRGAQRAREKLAALPR